MKRTLILVILFVLLALLLFFVFFNFLNKITGEITRECDYSWTKAICNETHCQDYEIICNGNDLVSQIPITGALIEISEQWADPRNQSFRNELCN